ncbi:MAG: transposase, partial [Armatimonadetes bacterium]|nr:transposase [Armatimonadota bacterium]
MSNRRYRNTYIDGCSHFCTASVVEYLPPLTDERLCRELLECWDRQRTRWGVCVEGFVIMPEHIHLLVRGNAGDVRKFMQYTLAETSRKISQMACQRAKAGNPEAVKWLETFSARANGTAVHKVWKERFRCVALDKEQAVMVKLQYIHNNPVKRGLVDAPS